MHSSYLIDFWFIPIMYWYRSIGYQYNWIKRFWETPKTSLEDTKNRWESTKKLWKATSSPFNMDRGSEGKCLGKHDAPRSRPHRLSAFHTSATTCVWCRDQFSLIPSFSARIGFFVVVMVVLFSILGRMGVFFPTRRISFPTVLFHYPGVAGGMFRESFQPRQTQATTMESNFPIKHSNWAEVYCCEENSSSRERRAIIETRWVRCKMCDAVDVSRAVRSGLKSIIGHEGHGWIVSRLGVASFARLHSANSGNMSIYTVQQ